MAYDLFKSSEVEEKRQLIKLILSNLRLSGKNLVFDAAKPFDLILNCSDDLVWYPLHHSLLNQTAPLKYPLSMMQTLFAEFNM